jgi:two-component system, chemotaxis family, sensor kinase CheA
MDLLDTFLRESHELIDDFEGGLVQLEEAGERSETVHALFRAAHTLKGNASMVGLGDFVRFTHVLESVLSRVRDGVLPVESRLVDAFLRAVDVLRAMVAAVNASQPLAAVAGYETVLAELAQVLGDSHPAPGFETFAAAPRDLAVELTLDCTPEQADERASALFADLKILGPWRELEPALGSGARVYRFLLHTDARRADLEALVMFADARVDVRDLAGTGAALEKPASAAQGESAVQQPTAAGKPAAPARAMQHTVRVDAERLDGLVDLTCEMVISCARTEQLLRDPHAEPRVRADAMSTLVGLVREVQERTMALRMVAVRDSFLRFARPVRDLARELGKQVALETSGLGTELDRKLIDQLADPLKHVIRNAIAHGIESPAQREAAGKPAIGQLLLSASQQNGAALIEIRDDGAGIDRARVIDKAVQKGLVEPGCQLSDRQVYDLLFLPGFSTAAQVDEVAGRGVGLDVLKRTVESLRGTIEIVSELGRGTAFRIRLPITLAIVDGMHVRVGAETLTIPLTSVLELLDGQTTPLGTLEADNEYVDLRGELLPIVRVSTLLDIATSANDAGMIVIVQTEQRRFGLHVDRVIGLARAVIKPLERSYAFIRRADRVFDTPAGVSGATVLGDGSVGLILDVSGLEAMAFGP